jgi:hypothetical protein
LVLKRFQKKYRIIKDLRYKKRQLKKNSNSKKAIRYSFKSFFTLLQLNKIQIGISIVVNNKKNKEIPSIPKVKFKFKFDNQ